MGGRRSVCFDVLDEVVTIPGVDSEVTVSTKNTFVVLQKTVVQLRRKTCEAGLFPSAKRRQSADAAGSLFMELALCEELEAPESPRTPWGSKGSAPAAPAFATPWFDRVNIDRGHTRASTYHAHTVAAESPKAYCIPEPRFTRSDARASTMPQTSEWPEPESPRMTCVLSAPRSAYERKDTRAATVSTCQPSMHANRLAPPSQFACPPTPAVAMPASAFQFVGYLPQMQGQNTHCAPAPNGFASPNGLSSPNGFTSPSGFQTPNCGPMPGYSWSGVSPASSRASSPAPNSTSDVFCQQWQKLNDEDSTPRPFTTPGSLTTPEPAEAQGKKKRPRKPKVVLPAKGHELTVMLRHVPVDYTPATLLLEMQAFLPNIDFFYLPTNFDSQKNLGYAFVNFDDKSAADRFCRFWRASGIPEAGEDPCQEARVQGFDANMTRFRDSSVMAQLAPELKPRIFYKGVPQLFPEPLKTAVRPRFRSEAGTVAA